jgi:hypothetical protein
MLFLSSVLSFLIDFALEANSNSFPRNESQLFGKVLLLFNYFFNFALLLDMGQERQSTNRKKKLTSNLQFGISGLTYEGAPIQCLL